jgi:RimJ/RimL family protein N-acetyltransferase
MSVQIRRAVAEDAAAALSYVNALFAEADHFTLTEADEFTLTVDQEREHLASVDWDAGAQYWLAVDGDEVVGMLSASPGRRRKIHHRVEIGMSVAASVRGQGVGRALMTACIQHCTTHPRIRKIALVVLHDNAPARALYARCGFVEEGRGVRAVQRRDGSYAAQVHMGLWLQTSTS